jgi:hypothetical protein
MLEFIFTVTVLMYVLGAYLMWSLADPDSPEAVSLRPWYAAFWPVVAVGFVIEELSEMIQKN